MAKDFIKIGNIHIRWYSIILMIAVTSAYLIICKEAKNKKIKDDLIVNIIFYGLLFGILGARVYYVLFNMNYYINNPLEIFMTWNGGLAIHGGILFGLLFLIIYSKKKNINILLLLDIITPGLIIAQAIGRWGNFFNQEAYGRAVSLSFLKRLYLPNFIIQNMYIDNHYREPTFLYESFFSFVGFLIIILLRKKKNIKVGQLTGIYLIWYGIERLVIETFRSDSLMVGNIKIAQLISIIFILTGVFLYNKNIKKDIFYKNEVLQKENKNV